MKYKEDEDKHVVLDEVVVTDKGAPREKIKLDGYEDLLPEAVEFLPEQEVNEMQNKATSAVRASRVNTNPERLNVQPDKGMLPEGVEQRDIKPVAVKEGSEKQGKQRRTLKDILDKAHNSRREMTPEERARWERNAAIMGDIARLGAQSYAIGNGAWKIEKAEPETKKANERIRALQEREYARMAQEAKERQERLKEQAKEALEQERWQKKFDADMEHQQWEKDKFDKELGFKQEQHHDNIELEKEKLKNKVKTAIETENITVNGKTYSKEKDGANYLIKAYVDAGMPPITRRVQRKNDVGGYDYNDDGSPIYLDVPVSNPTDAEIAMALLGAQAPKGAGKGMIYDYKKTKGTIY